MRRRGVWLVMPSRETLHAAYAAGEDANDNKLRDAMGISGVGRFGGLLLRLIDGLLVLLLVLLNLGPRFLDRNTLCFRQRLGGALAGLLGLRLIPGHRRPHSRNGCVAQRLRIVSAGRGADRLLDL